MKEEKGEEEEEEGQQQQMHLRVSKAQKSSTHKRLRTRQRQFLLVGVTLWSILNVIVMGNLAQDTHSQVAKNVTLCFVNYTS